MNYYVIASDFYRTKNLPAEVMQEKQLEPDELEIIGGSIKYKGTIKQLRAILDKMTSTDCVDCGDIFAIKRTDNKYRCFTCEMK